MEMGQLGFQSCTIYLTWIVHVETCSASTPLWLPAYTYIYTYIYIYDWIYERAMSNNE